MKKIIYIFLASFIMGCSFFKPNTRNKAATEEGETSTVIPADSEGDYLGSKKSDYRASREKRWDLIHTKLELSFDYINREGIGIAQLILKPWFYSQEELILDAKNMDIKSVEWLNKTGALSYSTDSMHLKILFNQSITDTVKIKIVYIAKPYSKKSKGSVAITEDRGLYFINADSVDTFKPTEIWTQGETEAASCWFPTIDAPNEKMTQEIYLTVDSALQTLSNGKLIKTIYHKNHTKTDYWVQAKPHAPYLAMIAVGPWKVYQDKWRDTIQVNYYMEENYIKYAPIIFGNTPAMMELFSKKLGVDYPWDKFSQVVVRDFVSGAMENTSAVVHGEFLNHDSRQHLDNSYEDVVSHELFHQWFGDLVTCESWSNLPLNESFATYGEYLWREYKYGKDDAEYHRLGNLRRYITESETKQEPLIRFYYKDKEDMFDNHSYQKGGLVLYSLRKAVGDDAFYRSLELYLKRNSFKSVEIHNLRLAFEEVTGTDLNWFFDAFFLSSGHPEISVESTYDAALKKVLLNFSHGNNNIYTLPMSIDIWCNGKPIHQEIILKPETDFLYFDVPNEPDFINIDPGKNWLCVWKRNNTIKNWKNQFENSTELMDQIEALDGIRIYINADSENKNSVLEILKNALLSSKKGVVIEALEIVSEIEEITTLDFIYKKPLIDLVQHHSEASIRNKALLLLSKIYDPILKSIYEAAAYDSSYNVLGNALDGLVKYDTIRAVNIAEEYIHSSNQHLQLSAMTVVSFFGKENYSQTFSTLSKKLSINARVTLITQMGAYLSRLKNREEANNILKIFEQEIAVINAPWYYSYMIHGNLDAAMQLQKDETIKAAIQKILDSIPDGGSIKMELR